MDNNLDKLSSTELILLLKEVSAEVKKREQSIGMTYGPGGNYNSEKLKKSIADKKQSVDKPVAKWHTRSSPHRRKRFST